MFHPKWTTCCLMFFSLDISSIHTPLPFCKQQYKCHIKISDILGIAQKERKKSGFNKLNATFLDNFILNFEMIRNLRVAVQWANVWPVSRCASVCQQIRLKPIRAKMSRS